MATSEFDVYDVSTELPGPNRMLDARSPNDACRREAATVPAKTGFAGNLLMFIGFQ